VPEGYVTSALLVTSTSKSSAKVYAESAIVENQNNWVDSVNLALLGEIIWLESQERNAYAVRNARRKKLGVCVGSALLTKTVAITEVAIMVSRWLGLGPLMVWFHPLLTDQRGGQMVWFHLLLTDQRGRGPLRSGTNKEGRRQKRNSV